jgi:shikimate dehydrogenase
LGMGRRWSYEAIDVAPNRFERRVRAMPGEGFLGANVTVPHKGAALALADELSAVTREVGATNTLVFRGGEIRAENTDAQGVVNALGASLAGRRALVLGAGGAARAVVWALIREDAWVEVWNRTELRSRHLCEELGGLAVADPDQSEYELIVNSTSVGLHGEDPFAALPLAAERFESGQTVLDMVYGPEPSRLLAPARAVGATVIDGIEVLVQQGALSFFIWTGAKAPLEVMRAAARG